jgi:hypothetical protein
MSSQYIIGIDLGTTNNVLAYAELNADSAAIELLEIPQLVAAGTIESLKSLPSFVYLGTESESAQGAFDLPWAQGRNYVVGQWARQRSAEAPDRTVVAAKSWLCHTRVDRRQPVLPAGATNEVEKISPVTASQYYLAHLIAAWEQQFPDARIADQQVVLTVPASFDPVARELTREAALAAGLPPDFILLEEPQAALYAWLASQGEDWRKQLQAGESVLVCDIGGGTTDLTLIQVQDDSGDLVLERAAVGDHLLVGGDNMDLTLAHSVAGKFAEQGTDLNPWQSVSLWHSCRAAKESLLAEDGDEAYKISVLGRGSKLIGGTVSVDVQRSEAATLLLDGFLPKCERSDRPARQPASGFQELGLTYESDPGITRHVAQFLDTHCSKDENESSLPKWVLFNGGVFKANGFRNRLLKVLQGWKSPGSDETVSQLAGVHDLDHAVATGACHYGWSKQNGGLRIRGGVAASYYVGIETAGLAIPGAPRPLKALCVVPFGMEEGSEADVPGGEIGLVTGHPAKFRFFSSNTRKEDQTGAMLGSWNDEELRETDPLEATLDQQSNDEESTATGDCVPVRFQSRITELGMFELWCIGTGGEGEWKLEFNVRES